MRIDLFIHKFESSRKRWNELIKSFQAEDLEKVGVIEGMSLKDLIAHISWYEMQMVELLSTRVLAGSDLWGLKHAERNQKIYEDNKDKGIYEILGESTRTYLKFISELKLLTDVELSKPETFEGMPGDWVPWMMIAENSYEHYHQHSEDLVNWYSVLYN